MWLLVDCYFIVYFITILKSHLVIYKIICYLFKGILILFIFINICYHALLFSFFDYIEFLFFFFDVLNLFF